MMRPAGMSDEDSDDSDGFGFMDEPRKRYFPVQQYNHKKKIETNLQTAIINGNLDEVKNIIISELKNDINDHLDTGWTPLMHACFHAQEKIVEYLLEMGADANLHCDSVTPIMLACSNSNASNEAIDNIVDKLLQKECILNVGDKYGETPLMRAISSGRVAVVKRLLELEVNIEMRDQKGWTASFVAVHHNQPEILELLILYGARLNEVDRSDRNLIDIGIAEDHQEVLEILKKHLKIEEPEPECYLNNNHVKSWHDYYPGVADGEILSYTSEIHDLLYGMNCERLRPIILNSNMNLKQFLLLEESDMLKLGIDLPFERQRLKNGLRCFHLKGWKVDAVAGLHAVKKNNYSVLDCLTTLGTHLQQVYILEATLQYTLRAYNRIQDQIKFEPPDSPALAKIGASVTKMHTNINSIRSEIKTLKKLLVKISSNNPYPVDVIKEKTYQEIAMGVITKVVTVGSMGLVAYNLRNIFKDLIRK